MHQPKQPTPAKSSSQTRVVAPEPIVSKPQQPTKYAGKTRPSDFTSSTFVQSSTAGVKQDSQHVFPSSSASWDSLVQASETELAHQHEIFPEWSFGTTSRDARPQPPKYSPAQVAHVFIYSCTHLFVFSFSSRAERFGFLL